MATPNRYAIELRDKDFNLKARLEPYITAVNWEWNRVGGCGRATLTVSGDYQRFSVDSDDDVRIYLPDADTNTSTLWYRGFVQNVSPKVSQGKQSIKIECSGYFGWLDRVIVHDNNSEKVFLGSEISNIVDSIVDDFVVSNSNITRGTTDESSVSPDTISFKGTAKQALGTLFDLVGAVQYGVGPDLVFYWRNESKAFTHRFYVGGEVTKLNDRVDYSGITNKIYFEGGDVNGSAFKTSGESSRSQSKFGLREEIVSNGSITTTATASRLISAILKQKAVPQRQLSISVKNIKQRLEATEPIGAIAVVDKDVFQDSFLYGTTGNGGSNITYGKVVNGGSGKKYGTTPRNQVDRIQYKMSPEDGRVDAEIQFGNSLGFSRASATMNRQELILNAVRQRSL